MAAQRERVLRRMSEEFHDWQERINQRCEDVCTKLQYLKMASLTHTYTHTLSLSINFLEHSKSYRTAWTAVF